MEWENGQEFSEHTYSTWEREAGWYHKLLERVAGSILVDEYGNLPVSDVERMEPHTGDYEDAQLLKSRFIL